MAKIILNAANIVFEDVADLTKHALKFLKKRWVKDNTNDFSTLVGDVVFESLMTAEVSEQRDLVTSFDTETSEAVMNSIDPGFILNLGHVLEVLNAGGAVRINGAFELHTVSTFEPGFVEKPVGYLYSTLFSSLLKKVASGELVVDNSELPFYLKTPAAKKASDEYYYQRDNGGIEEAPENANQGEDK